MTQPLAMRVTRDSSPLCIKILDRDDSAWVILQGEADIATLGDLEAALAHLELDDAKPVHLDVTELTFADVATIRRLAIFAQRARQAGHSVRTCGARPGLRKVANILRLQVDLALF
jgi:anti-anti-sigma regulatory factor